MPNYYTHLTFGARALELLPPALQAALDAQRPAFDLGCLGPDPLFFFRPGIPNPVRREGMTMHHRSALPAFRRLRAAVEERVPMAGGYAAGFLCHLALDSGCHGWILDRCARGDMNHLAMEAEFDRLLMERDGLEPLRRSYLPPVPERAVFQAAACAFAGADAAQVEAGYRSMRRDTALMARLHGTLAGGALTRASGRIKTLRETQGMILRAEMEQKYTESNQALERLVEKALPAAAEQIEKFFEAVRAGTPLSRWLDRDFEGGMGLWEESLPGLCGRSPLWRQSPDTP